MVSSNLTSKVASTKAFHQKLMQTCLLYAKNWGPKKSTYLMFEKWWSYTPSTAWAFFQHLMSQFF